MSTDNPLSSRYAPPRQPPSGRLERAARAIWPGVDALPARERTIAIGDVLAALYTVPLALVGLVWLILSTDLSLIVREAPAFALLLLLIILLQRAQFFLYTEIEPGSLITYSGSLDYIVIWAGALHFGPSALWLAVLPYSWEIITLFRRAGSTAARWSYLRDGALVITGSALAALLALTLYQQGGGRIPMPDLSLPTVFLALGGTILWWFLMQSAWLPLHFYWATSIAVSDSTRSFLRFLIGFLVWPLLVVPFAVLAAGLYAEHGVGIFLFYVAGLLLISVLARRLGEITERSQQRSREMELLERLGRDLINAPPDGSTLSQILAAYVPPMFPNGRVEIRLFPGRTLLHAPAHWPEVQEPLWEWAQTVTSATYFLPGATLPWQAEPDRRTQVVVPLQPDPEATPIGAVYLALPPQGVGPVVNLLPAVSALAAQICTALSRVESHAHELAHQKVLQELTLAGTIQASFLPTDLPDLEGWELAVTLVPALQTTGDFFDWIDLPDGRLGIVIADVVDKGLGAALFMALSRTLLRTYALETPDRPDLALTATNRRILQDTNRSMFVTVFYGVLDPTTGTFIYCNAGHNSPSFLSASDATLQPLPATGMPLGILPDLDWTYETIHFMPGDLLLLYTDGLTDAQNSEDAFFGNERLLEIAKAHSGRPAAELQQALLNSVYAWMGNAPQFDDLTILILGRTQSTEESKTPPNKQAAP